MCRRERFMGVLSGDGRFKPQIKNKNKKDTHRLSHKCIKSLPWGEKNSLLLFYRSTLKRSSRPLWMCTHYCNGNNCLPGWMRCKVLLVTTILKAIIIISVLSHTLLCTVERERLKGCWNRLRLALLIGDILYFSFFCQSLNSKTALMSLLRKNRSCCKTIFIIFGLCRKEDLATPSFNSADAHWVRC